MWKFVTVEDGMRNVCAAKKEMIYAVGHYVYLQLVGVEVWAPKH